MSNARIDSFLEKTVVPSFSSLGIRIRSRLYKWPKLSSYSLEGQTVLLTGATSGIGKAAAHRYATLGATLVIIARNPDKAGQLVNVLKSASGNHNIHSVIADLGDQAQVRSAALEIAEKWPVINVLAHNAGALFNDRRRAENGTDLSVELMVASPYLLTGLLLDCLKAASTAQKTQEQTIKKIHDGLPTPARVLTMSSGGMYTEALQVDRLEMRDANYQGAIQYARAKRAQVVLNEMWAERVQAQHVVFHSLHPGWVKTPGITEALPGFSKVLGPLGLLRTPDEGADSLLWLSTSPSVHKTSGEFWHDRVARNIDMSKTTRNADTPEQRAALWQWCETHTGWQLPTAV